MESRFFSKEGGYTLRGDSRLTEPFRPAAIGEDLPPVSSLQPDLPEGTRTHQFQ